MTIKYLNELEVGQVGQIATTENTNVKSRIADNVIEFGRAVFTGLEPGVSVKPTTFFKATVIYNSVPAFASGNKINMVINGNPMAEVTFDISDSNTQTLIGNAINAMANLKATVKTNELIIETEDQSSLFITGLEITGGASQTGFTIGYEALGDFEGISVLRHHAPIQIGGDDKYQDEDMVSVLTKGVIYVKVIADVFYGDAVHISKDQNNRESAGMFTNSLEQHSLGIDGARYMSTVTATPQDPALAKIEINQP